MVNDKIYLLQSSNDTNIVPSIINGHDVVIKNYAFKFSPFKTLVFDGKPYDIEPLAFAESNVERIVAAWLPDTFIEEGSGWGKNDLNIIHMFLQDAENIYYKIGPQDISLYKTIEKNVVDNVNIPISDKYNLFSINNNAFDETLITDLNINIEDKENVILYPNAFVTSLNLHVTFPCSNKITFSEGCLYDGHNGQNLCLSVLNLTDSFINDVISISKLISPASQVNTLEIKSGSISFSKINDFTITNLILGEDVNNFDLGNNGWYNNKISYVICNMPLYLINYDNILYGNSEALFCTYSPPHLIINNNKSICNNLLTPEIKNDQAQAINYYIQSIQINPYKNDSDEFIIPEIPDFLFRNCEYLNKIAMYNIDRPLHLYFGAFYTSSGSYGGKRFKQNITTVDEQGNSINKTYTFYAADQEKYPLTFNVTQVGDQVFKDIKYDQTYQMKCTINMPANGVIGNQAFKNISINFQPQLGTDDQLFTLANNAFESTYFINDLITIPKLIEIPQHAFLNILNSSSELKIKFLSANPVIFNNQAFELFDNTGKTFHRQQSLTIEYPGSPADWNKNSFLDRSHPALRRQSMHLFFPQEYMTQDSNYKYTQFVLDCQNITTINTCVFMRCHNIKKIINTQKIKNIDSFGFYQCINCMFIDCDWSALYKISRHAFDGVPEENFGYNNTTCAGRWDVYDQNQNYQETLYIDESYGLWSALQYYPNHYFFRQSYERDWE